MYRQCPTGSFPYVIRPGDTFYTLAQRYDTTIEAIAAANPGVDPRRLQIGQTICIPETEQPVVCPPGSTEYAVRSGDTFYSIARRFRIPLEALTAANPGVNPNNLQIGQIICVPSVPTVCPIGTAPYLVRSGDTFYGLSQRYGIPVQAIIAANPGVNPNNLQIGQTICLPSRPPFFGF